MLEHLTGARHYFILSHRNMHFVAYAQVHTAHEVSVCIKLLSVALSAPDFVL